MNKKIKNLAIIQARMGSSRLPDKVMLDLCEDTVLGRVIARVKGSRFINEIIVATTIEKRDLPIVKYCASNDIRVFCGSEHDVLDRYYQAARLIMPQNIVRITADCPILDSQILDLVISRHMEEKNDYTSNVLNPTFPDGLDCEIMGFNTLKDTWEKAVLASEREHVTQYIIKNREYKKSSVENPQNLSKERWTLDTEDDYRFLKAVYSELYDKKPSFDFMDVLELLAAKPELRRLNCHSKRNEGLEKSLKNDYIIDHKE